MDHSGGGVEIIQKFLAICAVVTIILTVVGCNKIETSDVYLDDVLSALDEAGIQYEVRDETISAYDIQREDTTRHLFQFEFGKLTVYIFSTAEHRKEVQRDPFPTAGAIPPNGAYGMGSILVFYYDGDSTAAQKLLGAFKPLAIEGEVN